MDQGNIGRSGWRLGSQWKAGSHGRDGRVHTSNRQITAGVEHFGGRAVARMLNLVGLFCFLAGLALLSVFLIFFGSDLPPPFSRYIGTGPIWFAFLVYFISLISLIVAMVGMTEVREALRSRFKALFIFAVSIVIVFCVFVSYLWYAYSNAGL